MGFTRVPAGLLATWPELARFRSLLWLAHFARVGSSSHPYLAGFLLGWISDLIGLDGEAEEDADLQPVQDEQGLQVPQRRGQAALPEVLRQAEEDADMQPVQGEQGLQVSFEAGPAHVQELQRSDAGDQAVHGMPYTEAECARRAVPSVPGRRAREAAGSAVPRSVRPTRPAGVGGRWPLSTVSAESGLVARHGLQGLGLQWRRAYQTV